MNKILLAILASSAVLVSQSAIADTLCSRGSTLRKRLMLVSGSTCPVGWSKVSQSIFNSDSTLVSSAKDLKGDKGDQGAKGDTGADGAAGIKGDTGAAGV